MINFENSILVVAHPDDEILWFSSIIDKVDKIIIVFNETQDKKVHEGRKKIFSQNLLPYKNKIINLNIEESDVFNSSNWKFPKPTDYGVKLSKKKYINNFDILIEKLSIELKNFKNIFTHNPWGEYGHEEHTQVFKAIQKISIEQNFFVWVSSYFSEQSFPLMSLFKDYLSQEFFSLQIENNFCQKVKSIYLKNNAWTWSEIYNWPQSENFYKINPNKDNLVIKSIKTPKVWDQMNFILMYHVHLSNFSIIRSKVIKILNLILPNYLFKLIVKFKNKK